MLDLNAHEKKMLQLAEPYNKSANNESHIEDVMNFALRLLKTEHADRDIVIPAVILHDIGWSQVPVSNWAEARAPGRDMKIVRAHEREGVKVARRILERIIWNDTKIDEILLIIDGHDTRKEAISVNDQIVKDADKISRYSEQFMPVIKRTGMAPVDYIGRLESQIKKWFFLPASMKMAEEELLKRKREVEISKY